MENQLPTHATGVLALFSTSRAGIDKFSDDVIEAVKTGEVSPLQVRVWIKTMEEIIGRVNTETKDNQLTEAEKHPESRFEFAGAMIEKAELGTKYNFASCKDAEWDQFDREEKMWATRRKERESFLKALTKPTKIITDDGEAATIYPPHKTSTTGLKISIR